MSENVVLTPGSSNHPIVAAVDGSEISYQAVAWAAVEAELRHCPLHIITSSAIPPGREIESSVGVVEHAELRAEGQRVLSEAARIARHVVPETVVITTELSLGLIIPVLVDRSKQATLMVVGNRGQGSIRTAVLGSVSAALSRHAHCPVAVVHGVSQTDPAPAHEPVVVGVDGTANSLPAIELAFQEASWRKVGLRAVHAWCDTSGFDAPVIGWDRARETQELLLGQGLAGMGERFPDVRIEQIVACDTPVRALLEHAADAQLLVVGSHGRGGFAGVTLGSVSTALLFLAQCPVLVVRQS